MRIETHPILGEIPKGPEVEFTLDGQPMTGREGEPIAVALRAGGVLVHRYTANLDKPRGVFCAIGRCTDCIMIVDGKPNIRTCVTALRAGMAVETQHGHGVAPEGV